MAAASLTLSAQWRTFHTRFKTRHGTRADSAFPRAGFAVARSIHHRRRHTMKARPRLLLTAIFLFGLTVTAVTLAAIGRIAEAGAPTWPSAARMREAPPQPATPHGTASVQQTDRRAGDHPAVIVQRLHAQQGYDYASKFYPHPAWLHLHAEAPHPMMDHPAVIVLKRNQQEALAAAAKPQLELSAARSR
jgi:hypothetical protein